MKKLHSLVLLMLVLCLCATACGGARRRAARQKAEVEALVEEVAQKVLEPTATSEPGEEPAATVVSEEKAEEEEETPVRPTPVSEEPTPTPEEPAPVSEQLPPQPATGPSVGLLVTPEESLGSFRKQTTTRVRQEDGSWGPEVKMEVTWVREPEVATHMVMYDEAGAVGAEMISIGDQHWMKVGDMWVMSTAAETPEQGGLPADWDQLMREVQEAMEGGMVWVGEETVNGVHCKRYTLDAQVSIPFPVPPGAAEKAAEMLPTEVLVREKGDVWVAEQRGLPQVTIRSRTEAEMITKSLSGEMATMIQQQSDVFDINEPIRIEPPSEQEIGAAAGEYPMMPDAQVRMTTKSMTLYTTASALDAVVAFYETNMPAAGWVQEGQTKQMMNMAMMQFTKEGQSVNVTISPAEEGDTQVMLMAGQ